jgi:hypothetical protein
LSVPLALYHWYANEVGILDQVPRLVLSTEPTLTEEPGIEGGTEFAGIFIIIFILKGNIIFNVK